MPLQCVTQWDSLAHVFYEGRMWNGYDISLVTSSGAAKNSIDKTKGKIVGRGVLLDVARHKGVKRARAGLRDHAGRSRGTAASRKSKSKPAISSSSAPVSCRRYLERGDWSRFEGTLARRVGVHRALDARESKSRPWPGTTTRSRCAPPKSAFRSPFHACAIPNMGLTLGEIFYLEDLAADCAADGRYAFLLVAPPLPVTRGVGTPINPYAMK